MGKRIKLERLYKVQLSYFREILRKGLPTPIQVMYPTLVLRGTYTGEEAPAMQVSLYERRGEERILTAEHTINIIEERANIGRGNVYYFQCPITGRKCRTLYTDGKTIASRFAFPHIYHSQTLSHKWRTLHLMPEPFTPRGKEHYRHKLTPYGKRVARYYKQEERILGALSREMHPKASKV